MATGWTIQDSHGDAGAFHRADPAPTRSATFHTVGRPTLVLGSAQAIERVDHRVADALGVDVVHRRSGGGAVLLLPGEFVWLDLVIPVGDPLWVDDVGNAMRWVGECWSAALAGSGIVSTVHTGRLVGNDWSRDVCFAGLGTGEVVSGTVVSGTVVRGTVVTGTVVTGSRKLVGVSQRRTRTWARFQSMCHLRFRPELVAALVAPPRPTAVDLAGAVAVATVDAVAMRSSLVAALPLG